MEKNTAGKWIVFAYGLPDHASAGKAITGDAANITANVRIDGGAANAVDDTNPTELEDGYYVFDITAAEANGDLILVTPASSTTDVQVIGVPGAVWTRPPNFNLLGVESDGDLTKVNLCATTTANSDMRGTDSAALASVCTETRLAALTDWLNGGRLDLLLDAIPTTAMRGTDSAALASVCTETRLAALTDWLNGGRLDLLLDAIPTTAMRGTDSAALASVCTETRLAALTDWLNGGRLDLLLDAIPTTAMRGTDSAATATALATAQTDLDTITGSDGVTLATAQALYAPNKVVPDAAGTEVDADIKKINGVTITGDGSATPFDV